MLAQHAPVVHLVNVVAREDERVLGLLRADGIDVLVNRIGRAHVPVFAHPLHGRKDLDELAHLATHDVPTFANMPVQRQRFVLGKDEDAPQIGIDAIGERDIDDPVDPAEGNGWLGSVTGEGVESLARASGQQDSQRILHCSLRFLCFPVLGSFWALTRPQRASADVNLRY